MGKWSNVTNRLIMSELVRIALSAELPKAVEVIRENQPVRYGVDNMYPQFLYSAYFNGSIHKGIINQKVTYLVAQGFKAKQNNENVFVDTDEVDEFLEGVALDLEVLSYAVVKAVKSWNGLWKFEAVESEKCRFSSDYSTCYIAEDWSKRKDIIELPYYKDITDEDRECFLVIKFATKQYKGEEDNQLMGLVYPQPIYSGSLADILAHTEMSWYDYAETKNGFVSNTLIELNNGIPNEEDSDEIRKKYQKQFQDRSKKGGIVLHFNDSKDNGMTISELAKTNVGVYNDTMTRIERRIMIAHSVQNASLFGLEVEGSLGGTSAEEQVVAFDKFVKTYVLQRHNMIKKVLNLAYRDLNGTELGFEFNIPRLNATILGESNGEQFDKQSGLIDDNSFIAKFESRGKANDGKTVLFKQSFDGQSDSDTIKAYFNSRKSIKFFSTNQEMLLNMISNGAKWSELLKSMSLEDLYNTIKQLEKQGLIDGLKITDKGSIEVSEKEEDFVVEYTYEEIAGIPPAKSGSRPVCTSLMARTAMGVVYTREEIDAVGAEFGVDDIWRYRGGWYHNPVTNRTTRGCRHEWVQNVKFK